MKYVMVSAMLVFLAGCSVIRQRTMMLQPLNNCRYPDKSLAAELEYTADGYQCQNGEWVKLIPTPVPTKAPMCEGVKNGKPVYFPIGHVRDVFARDATKTCIRTFGGARWKYSDE